MLWRNPLHLLQCIKSLHHRKQYFFAKIMDKIIVQQWYSETDTFINPPPPPLKIGHNSYSRFCNCKHTIGKPWELKWRNYGSRGLKTRHTRQNVAKVTRFDLCGYDESNEDGSDSYISGSPSIGTWRLI